MTKKKDLLQAIAVFFITLLICLLIIVPAIRNRMDTDKVRLEQLIDDTAIKISQAITNPINQLNIVSSYIERHNGDISNIREFAEIVTENPHIRNVILAPDGLVTAVYPETEDNLNVIGLDYYSDSSQGNREAVIAAQARSLLLAGPFTTVVGDEAVSGRLPVYLEDEYGNEVFWGLISITLRYPEVLESCNLQLLGDQGLSYEIWRNNVDTQDEQIILSEGKSYNSEQYLDKAIVIANAEWHIKAAPVLKWYQYQDSWSYGGISILISIMMAMLVMNNQGLKQAKKKLETMLHHDHLTKVLNRQGLFDRLEALLQKQQDFLIYFMDLNAFKGINDRYGHAAGDYTLIEFTRRINLHLNKNHIFARISGDEFILIYINANPTDAEVISFWNAITKEFESPIVFHGENIFLSFSKGMASYPADGDTVDEVMLLDDERMYSEKNNNNKAASL